MLCGFGITERILHPHDFLISLVSFASQKHGIRGIGIVDRLRDGFGAVFDDPVVPSIHAGSDGRNNVARIFSARVVRSDHASIGKF